MVASQVGETADATEKQAAEHSDNLPSFYKSRPTGFLEQGDIIPRDADVVQEVLRKYHGYHVDRTQNEMFAVLTQSCDLVLHSGACKARYISVAPVRSLRTVLRREFQKVLVRTPGDLYTLGSEKTRGKYVDFLTKLINNNEARHFYLPEQATLGIAEDMCIMLPLALPIRSEHYESCLSGRTAQLDDLFQAKLGWLLGQLYSRVGTPDWPEAWVSEKVNAVSEGTLSWFPDNDFAQVKKLLAKRHQVSPDVPLDEKEFTDLIGKIKNRKQLAIDAIFALLDEMLQGLPLPPPDSPQRLTLRRRFASHEEFSKFFPNS